MDAGGGVLSGTSTEPANPNIGGTVIPVVGFRVAQPNLQELETYSQTFHCSFPVVPVRPVVNIFLFFSAPSVSSAIDQYA